VNSIDDAIARAKEIGRYEGHNDKALIPGTNVHQTPHDIGNLVLDIYRDHGVDEVKAVVRSYQEGYNSQAADLGLPTVDWDQIRNGIGLSLPNRATDDEEDAIPAAL
jgi:hypothetical protein